MKSFRPTSKIKSPFCGANWGISNPHEHEFGIGYDIYYKDGADKVLQSLDGLTPSETQYLKKIHKIDTPFRR